jgi:rare lipoprotein A
MMIHERQTTERMLTRATPWARRALVLVATVSLGCAAGDNHQNRAYSETGLASYYAHALHGRTTASGEVYDEHKLTAAHRRLPFGTRVRVTNLANRRSVIVRINDRGPFVRGRIIDLSFRAAGELGFVTKGVTKVGIEILD